MTIYFVTTSGHQYTIKRHLLAYGNSQKHLIRPINYTTFAFKREPAVYVLADIERLSPLQRNAALRVADRLIARGGRVLNHPQQVKTRHALLKTLAEQGENLFSAYRVSDCVPETLRYPVFLRCENDHKGARSELIHSQDALERAITEQARTRFCFVDEHGKWRPLRLGPRRRKQLLITEFCETVGEDGYYRKYSAFNVGGRIVARHLFFGSQWMLKAPRSREPWQLEEERGYVRSNPHEAPIREAFRLANIDYGRIDYSLLDESLQTWEINTNPMITGPLHEQVTERIPVQNLFAHHFDQAIQALLSESLGEPFSHAA